MPEQKPIIGESEKFFTLSEFRRELGIPLVLAKKLIVWGLVEGERAADGTWRIAVTEIGVARKLLGNPWQRWRLFVRALGPGLITGVSDDDPSGIGTYSSVGAKFGLAIIWMAAWLLPIMLAVQETCARIGIVTNRGLASVLKKYYHKWVVLSAVILLIIANIANIGADLGAMAASTRMLTGVNFYLAAIGFAVMIILVEVFVDYRLYAKILKWLTLSVFSYIIAGLLIHPEWLVILKNSFVPHITFSEEYFFAMVAVFGTTITPYLFFWQASEEVEEGRLEKSKQTNSVVHSRLVKMRTDVNAGMFLANIVFFFIVLTTAQVLFRNGITNIESAEQAALALKPFAGQYAYLLFALGIIGTGMLAVPILAGSGAYALAEVMDWKEGLGEKFSHAQRFYLVIVASIIFGLGLNFLHINPITALYYAAFLNGIIALPLLIVIMLIGHNKQIMGHETNPAWVTFFGWLSIVFMAALIVGSVIIKFH
jgi:NRAMP (natural resistance-associated macrophage protein)-like metal ion transporter